MNSSENIENKDKRDLTSEEMEGISGGESKEELVKKFPHMRPFSELSEEERERLFQPVAYGYPDPHFKLPLEDLKQKMHKYKLDESKKPNGDEK